MILERLAYNWPYSAMVSTLGAFGSMCAGMWLLSLVDRINCRRHYRTWRRWSWQHEEQNLAGVSVSPGQLIRPPVKLAADDVPERRTYDPAGGMSFEKEVAR